MIRSIFFTFGLFILLWGTTFLIVDRIVIETTEKTIDQSPVWNAISTRTADHMHELAPPLWAPYAMLALGSVTMLYSVALPKKQI